MKKNYWSRIRSYSETAQLTTEEISEDVGCEDSTALKILALCEAGYEQGRKGIFTEDTFEESPEWKSGPGLVIEQVKNLCNGEEGPIE